MFKKVKGLFTRGEDGDEGIRLRRTGILEFGKRLERYAAAAALAQGGAQDAARDIVRGELQERPRILVVGNGYTFSPPMVEYAVGLARRLGYEIVALSCAPTRSRTLRGLGPSEKERFEEFRRKAAIRGVELMARRAAEEGVPFQHVVGRGSMGRCIRELEWEVSRLKFVLTEPESTDKIGKETSVPVFSLVG